MQRVALRILLAVAAVAAVYLSVRRRVGIKVKSIESKPGIEGTPGIGPKPSPLAEAIKELLGMAGAIYLGLVLVVSFLELQVPKVVELWGIQFDPLALLALVAAIVQPFFVKAQA